MPTSTQLRATWHIDSLDMVVLPSTSASRYHNSCIDGCTSPEYFGYHIVFYPITTKKLLILLKHSGIPVSNIKMTRILFTSFSHVRYII
jgi:hypothetical protein